MKSLKAKSNPLANYNHQVELLESASDAEEIPRFSDKIAALALNPLKPTSLDIFQINVGKMCNQVCAHCHVDAGPDRKEIMTKETMQQCLDVLAANDFKTVDLTGGAPEMNPNFRWFVEEIHKLGKHIIVRSNLTIILANPKYKDLPDFFKKYQVEVVSSLPFYNADRTDRQRGKGVFDKSIEALQMLNAVGYGVAGSGLIIDLVYNPSGAFLPGSQVQLEADFKQKLFSEFGIVFNKLFTITNLPISRFLDYLVNSGNYEKYMEKLVNAFNPEAAANVMCRSMVSIGWDGYIYDCDFNQMLDLKIATKQIHIVDYNAAATQNRDIILGNHCYGCTAGAGSSCGGAIA